MKTRAAIAIALAWSLFAAPSAALNAKVEGAAKQAIDRAAQEFGSGKIDAAFTRLQKALAACGVDKCNLQTKAALIRDSAAIEFKRGSREAGYNGLVAAFSVDPTMGPSTYDVPEMKSEWEPAKDEAAATKGPQPKGDFTHTPGAEQTVNTPLPIYVEYSGGKLTRVAVKYKGTGMSEYKRLPLTKKKDGWVGTIPCGDVRRGGMKYYFEGFDQAGDVMATTGSPAQPFGVPIRTKISGPAPSLPGASPPKACSGESSTEAPTEGALGAACGESSECKSGRCADGVCAEVEEKKKKPAGEHSTFWIGIAGSMDFIALPGGDDVCKRTDVGVAINGVYYCTNPDGSNYPGGPTENAALDRKGGAGQTAGGFTPGNIRLMLTFDVAASANVLIGARVGLVLNRYPGTDAIDLGHGLRKPIHLEARLTYLFGDAPLARAGFAPYVFGSGGMAGFDASAPVLVVPNAAATPPNTTAQPKDAWLVAGGWFVAAGGGARYAFTPNAAAMLGLRVAGAPGASGIIPIFAPELALHFGF